MNLNLASTSDAPGLSGLDPDELKLAVQRWFLSNFEDPADNTPYESKEGGYQYIWGGPYSARDEIADAFHDQLDGPLSEGLLEEIVEELERRAIEWAPHSNRIYPEPDGDEEPPPDPYQEIQYHLDQAERLMARLEPASSLLGHNAPPEEIGLPPYSHEDKHAIELAITVLRQPQQKLAEAPEEATRAAEVLRERGQKLKQFFAEQGHTFVKSFSAQLGKRAADSLTVTLWVSLSTTLLAAAAAVLNFIQHVQLPF